MNCVVCKGVNAINSQFCDKCFNVFIYDYKSYKIIQRTDKVIFNFHKHLVRKYNWIVILSGYRACDADYLENKIQPYLMSFELNRRKVFAKKYFNGEFDYFHEMWCNYLKSRSKPLISRHFYKEVAFDILYDAVRNEKISSPINVEYKITNQKLLYDVFYKKIKYININDFTDYVYNNICDILHLDVKRDWRCNASFVLWE